MKLEKGMIVNVKDWGEGYCYCSSWFKRYYHKGDIPLDYVIKYVFGDESNFIKNQHADTNEYQILFVDEVEEKVLITDSISDECHRVYLVGFKGIKPVRKEMTLEEIEEALGYKIKIVESN